MYSILFVCSGNIIRSVTAEFLFKKLLNDQYGDVWKSKIKVDSGAVIYKNSSISQLARKTLLSKGIKRQNLNSFQPRHIDDYPSLFKQADLILVMTEKHLNRLKNYDSLIEKSKLLTNYLGKADDIPDPYFSEDQEKTMKIVVNLIEDSLEKLLLELKDKNILL